MEWEESSLWENEKRKRKETLQKRTVLEEKVKKLGTRTVSGTASAEVWSLMTPVTHNQFISFVVLHSQTMQMSSIPHPLRMGSVILYSLTSANASKVWPS